MDGDFVFYDNLALICRERGVKIATIVKECGGAVGSIDGWKKGAVPRSDIVAKLSLRLDVSTDFLLFGDSPNNLSLSKNAKELIMIFNSLSPVDQGRILGRAEMLSELASESSCAMSNSDKSSSFEQQLEVNFAPDVIKIRYYSYPASAGTGLFLDETVAETLTIRNTPEAQEADYAIPVSGDSMEDEYHDGDIVLVKSCPCVRKGEVGIFLIDGDVCIKEYGGTCLISYNADYNPIDLDKFETAACLGKVLGIAEVVS